MSYDFEESMRKNEENDKYWNDYLGSSSLDVISNSENLIRRVYNRYGDSVEEKLDQTVKVGDKEFDIVVTHRVVYGKDQGWHVSVYSDKVGDKSYEWHTQYPRDGYGVGFSTKDDALTWAHREVKFFGSLKPYPGKEEAPLLVGGLTAHHWLDLATPDGDYKFALKWDQCCHLYIDDQYVHTDDIDELIDLLIVARDIAREHYKDDPNQMWYE